MGKEKKRIEKRELMVILLVFALFVLLLTNVSAAYSKTSPAYTQTNLQSHTGNIDFPYLFNREMCGAGQDFILQIDPLGCKPPVVRSDILEDQNAVILCPVVATKINPLIDIEAISRITFSFNGPAPKEVQGISYVPSRAALVAPKLQLNQPVFNDLGYVVIVLKRQPNESAMPEFVTGNLTATLRYDIKNAFGVGQATYYLPEMSDDEQWEERYLQYGFWRGRGYLRAENVDGNSATISVYSDREDYGTKKSGDKRRIASHDIEVGKKSPLISVPGFNYCLASMEIELVGLVEPTQRAKLRVNEEIFEVKEGEPFLENKCTVIKIEKVGVLERTTVKCKEDDKTRTNNLINSPKIRLRIDGVEKEVAMGDKLFFSDDPNKQVYLAYVSTKAGTGKEEHLYARLVKTPDLGDKLTEDKISQVAKFDNADVEYKGSSIKKVANFGTRGLQASAHWIEFFARYLGDGTVPSVILDVGQEKVVFGSKVTVLGFASPIDTALEGDAKINYGKAKQDYETIREDFSSDIYPKVGEDQRTLGEKALFNYISMAWATNQKKTTVDLCKEFSEKYPDSIDRPTEFCDNALALASAESSVINVAVNGRNYLIAFDQIVKPDSDEYGTDIIIDNASVDCNGPQTLALNEDACFSSTEFIKFVKADNGVAEFDVRSVDEGGVKDALWKTNTLKIKEKESVTIGKNQYKITVNKINLKKLAKVEVKPNIHLADTKADFKFKIGIEKRAIQLSPEKTKSRIENLNKTLEKWRGINSRLGTIVETGKKACLATGTVLTAKNFLANLGGKGIARQKVMRSDNGWFEICQNGVNQKTPVNGKVYDDIDSCLLGNSDAIENSVNTVSSAMETQNNQLKTLQDKYKQKDGFLGEDVINTEGLLAEYTGALYKQEINQNVQGKFANDKIKIGNDEVSVSTIINTVNPNTVSLSQARNLQLNSRLLNSQDPTVKKIAEEEVRKTLADIYVNSANEAQKQSVVGTLTQKGLGNLGVSVYVGQDAIIEPYNGQTTTRAIGSLPQGANAAVVSYKNIVYIVQLEHVKDNDYSIIGVYDESGKIVDNVIFNEIRSKFVFKKFDENSYVNPYTPASIARIRYFESDPYRGLPALVPFDLEKGWYAAVKSTVAVGSNIRAYDDSGRISSLYLCNIGPNRKEQGIGVGDDICQMINLGTGQPFNQFPGIEKKDEATKLVSNAVKAIEQASVARARDPKVSQVTINGKLIKVGEPAADIPDIQCQDFMSPTDCNILFNVCDPVVCPSSRCDLGGSYPVRDVVQSGVAGSLLLCLPNFPEVKVPICLSGVHAGLEGYLTVLDSYQQCLQTSLDKGQTVGVCDEIHSIYMCDFFWRQGLPIANILVPKAIGSVLGQNSKGGGEYLGVQDAWKRAGDSVDFMTQYYAADSFKAFKARSTETIGTEICKNWASLTAPDGGNLLDALTKPDVPAQFYGRFDEIPYTSATNPPISQYKVFYHIYAGKDFPAYYQVYLKGTEGTFFRDTDIRRVVASGFIPVGQYETQTPDLTAPSGYKELCIVVNNQEECGFKQVTTEFGIDYITEKFVAQQASEKDITSESACISGTPSLLALSPNLQSTAESAINPQLYNRGIIRICSSDNPGKGTDEFIGTNQSRWASVGYCGNENIKCWLDKQSVKDVLHDTNIEKEALQEVSQNYVDALGQNIQIVDEGTFENIVKAITDETDPVKKIEIIAKNYNQILFNHQKGYLTLLRADAYAQIAKTVFEKMRVEARLLDVGGVGITSTSPGITTRPGTTPETAVGTDNVGRFYPVFTFNDGTFDSDLHYSFLSDEWVFSEDKSRWTPVDAGEIAIFSKQSEKDKVFIKSLIGQNYNQGLEKLMGRIRQNNEGGFLKNIPIINELGDASLDTQSVKFYPSGVFRFEKGPIHERLAGRIYLDIPSKNWRWTFIYDNGFKEYVVIPDSTEDDRPINELTVEGVTVKLTGVYEDLINSLRGKGSVEGAEIIFSIDTENPLENLADTPSLTESGLKCESCGKTGALGGFFNGCDRNECNDIAKTSGLKCVFEDVGFNSCLDSTLFYADSAPLSAYVPETLTNELFEDLERKNNAAPKYIVLHHTGGTKVLDAVSAMVKDGNSIHYIVDDSGHIIRVVPEEFSAQHANCINSLSIGIEIVNKGDGIDSYSTLQKNSITKLLSYLIEKYDIQPGNVIGHGCTNPDKKSDEPTGLDPDFMYKSDPNFPTGYNINKKSTNSCPVNCDSGSAQTPTTTTTASSLKCSTKAECEQAIGGEVIDIAKEIKQQNAISDTTVLQNTGAKSFECLVLMIAYRESDILHCKAIQVNQDPLYCNGDYSENSDVIGGDATAGGSVGTMQVNRDAHENVYPPKLTPGVYDFETNVRYATNLLVQNYKSFGKEQRIYTCNSITYTGWQSALRHYNGWTSGTVDCTKGNTRYVDEVLGFKDEVENLFPECKV